VLLRQEPGRLAQPETGRDAHQFLAGHRAGQPDPDRQVDAPQLDLPCPGRRRRGVEAQLGDDVGRVRGLPLEGAVDQFCADVPVPFGIAADPHVLEVVADGLQLLEQAERVGKRPRGLGGVAPDDEHRVHLGGTQAGHDVGQMGRVPDQSGGHVRRGGEAVAGQPLGQLDGRRQALGLGRRDGQGHVARDVLGDRFLRVPERQHLVARVAQCGCHDGAPRSPSRGSAGNRAR
jgi:hypothetical protein